MDNMYAIEVGNIASPLYTQHRMSCIQCLLHDYIIYGLGNYMCRAML